MVHKKITYGLITLIAGFLMAATLFWMIFYLPYNSFILLRNALVIFSFLCIFLGGLTLWEGIAHSRLTIPTKEQRLTIPPDALPKLGLIESQQALAREITKHRRIFLIRTIILILSLPGYGFYFYLEALTVPPEEFTRFLSFMGMPMVFIGMVMIIFLRRYLYFLKASSAYLKHTKADPTQASFTAGILSYHQLFSQFLIERWDIPKIERSQHLILETKTGIGFELFGYSTAAIGYIGMIPLLLIELASTPPPLIAFNLLLMVWMLAVGLIEMVLSIQWIRMGWRLLKAFVQSDHWATDLEQAVGPIPKEVG